jgi:polyvinyl alcohol dehydrogenase (cytochrome)
VDFPYVALFVALIIVIVGIAGIRATVNGGPDWGMIGHDSANTRSQPFEHTIGPSNVNQLRVKWIATTTGDVSATPAVVNGAVYVGDFGGTLWKLDAETGQVIWSHHVSDYTGIAGDIARTSPSVAGNTLVVGDLKHPDMLGIDADTGELRWITQVHPPAVNVPGGLVYGTFGQPYTEPASVAACNAAAANGFSESCEQPGSYLKSIVAFEVKTGQPQWSYRVRGHAPWQRACGSLPLSDVVCKGVR